jgi:hypothetical protein
LLLVRGAQADDNSASCEISSGMGGSSSAGFYTAAVRQSAQNQGFATVNETDLPIDFQSGQV